MNTRMLYPGTFQHHTFELVLFYDWFSYLIDAWQCGVLFLDALRRTPRIACSARAVTCSP